MRRRSPRILATLVGAGTLLASGQLGAAEPKGAPSKVERIAGTTLSRVILTEQAVVRIGIATAQLREIEVVRKRLVAGLAAEPVTIVTAVAAAQNAAPAPVVLDQAVQRIEVQPVGELDKMAGGRPVRVLPLTGADAGNVLAKPSDTALVVLEAEKSPNVSLIFEVHGATKGMLDPGPVLVELALSDGAVRKVVPYDAVLYDIRGETWVYTSPEPRVFVRHPVVVEYIDKGLAVLREGPPVNTAIVTVGVAELYGTEFKIGK